MMVVLIVLAAVLVTTVVYLCGVATGVFLSTGAASLERVASGDETEPGGLQ